MGFEIPMVDPLKVGELLSILPTVYGRVKVDPTRFRRIKVNPLEVGEPMLIL